MVEHSQEKLEENPDPDGENQREEMMKVKEELLSKKLDKKQQDVIDAKSKLEEIEEIEEEPKPMTKSTSSQEFKDEEGDEENTQGEEDKENLKESKTLDNKEGSEIRRRKKSK
jgi:hypothetical protein